LLDLIALSLKPCAAAAEETELRRESLMAKRLLPSSYLRVEC
jgi:hypothetical protein